MNINIENIRLAYNKLKTYIYYDNSELFLRERLVEFETDTYKSNSILNRGISPLYSDVQNITDIFTQIEPNISENLELKFEKLLNELINYNDNNEYFSLLFNSIQINFFPKRIYKNEHEDNFITNKKTHSKYEIEKTTAFIDMPIEFHIISILWINGYGIKFDMILLNECKGNRLLLNKDNSGTINTSSLFKPYFTQYQKWRDESIIVAQNL